MSFADRVQAFVDCVLSNAHVQAIEAFYHEDATMQENLNPPRGPRAVLMESERRMLAAHKRVVTSLLSPVFINGDQVVLHWAFEFTRPDDSVMRIEELAHQTWRGDRIAAERFYYDPAQMAPSP